MEPTSEKRCTYEEFLQWEDNNRWELYDGQLMRHPTPHRVHQGAVVALVSQFANYLLDKQPDIWMGPLDVRLFEKDGDRPCDIDTVVQPDLFIVCNPDQMTEHGCKGAPDMIIEILSPFTLRLDRRVKYELYQKAGVPEYWIVDPEQQIVLVHTLEDGRYGSPVAYLATSEVPVGVLEDFRIDLKIVFQ